MPAEETSKRHIQFFDETIDPPTFFTGEKIAEPFHDCVSIREEQICRYRDDDEVIDYHNDASDTFSDLANRCEETNKYVVQLCGECVGDDIRFNIDAPFCEFVDRHAEIDLSLLDHLGKFFYQALKLIDQSGNNEEYQQREDDDDW